MKFTVQDGVPLPLGPTLEKDGVNFALFSAHASSVSVCLFSDDGKKELTQLPLQRTGDIWHGFVSGLKANQLYGYRVDGPYAPSDGHRFNKHKLLIDPYAKQLFGEFILDDALYGFDKHSPEKDLSFDTRDSAPFMPKCIVGEPKFDWGDDKSPGTSLADTIIYECHIKGVTKLNSKVPEKQRGTPEGLASPAMIKHFKSLGVSAVEILPLQSFMSEPRLIEMGLTNYWGYNPINYFAPHNAYLGPAKNKSIQTMVKALHGAGIEVILDVVYNHTGESWELGPTLSYRGIDNKSYYHLQKNNRYYENYTGCGNALDMTHPAVLDLTIASLRYWVENYGFDGFRFDLGPTMGRNPVEFDRDAPFFKALQSDPVLSKVKLISEPWDIGPGGYQLGAFPNDWSEWNDQYRDTVRSFWRGDNGAHHQLSSKLLGSAQQFDHDGKSALTSINLISAHDGFTLHDTVSYNRKHNIANGEDNRDGHGHNLSDNMGNEGPSDNPAIRERRHRRKVNMFATLLLSQGVPMLLAGDAIGQTQQGNNNAYCQDNSITWLDWDNADTDLLAAVAELIHLRKKYPHFRQDEFLHGEVVDAEHVKNVSWVNADGRTMSSAEWEDGSLGFLGLILSLKGQGSVFIAINRGHERALSLPYNSEWELVFSSAEDGKLNHISAETVTVYASSSCAAPNEIAENEITTAAENAGIISEFRDLSGHVHVATPRTKAAILKAMGTDRAVERSAKAATSSERVFGAELLRDSGKIWGVTAALYGLKSDRNWGVGDFEDLAEFAEVIAQRGAAFIGINPVHALFPSAPHLFAPYSPSSRSWLNVMHIAPDKMDELASENIAQELKKLSELRAASFVNYGDVYGLKMSAFEKAYTNFKSLSAASPRRKEFGKFVKSQGKLLQRHALFDAIFETLPKPQQTYEGFKNFPKNLQDPESSETKKFAKLNADRVEFYSYLQWIAQTQLKLAQSRAKAAGMSIGLYLDFAVGVVPGGSDAWQNRRAFAQSVSLGAPGDAANPDGQLWNLLPLNPHVLTANGFEPYRSMLAHTMEQAGAVRIDHILGHMRSFWTVIDANGNASGGAYVRYPLSGLLAMIAEESQKAKCLVIGEDLGTIPDGLRSAMQQVDLMGCGIAIIERDPHGHILPISAARELSLTAYSNHDFPTLSGFWDGEDFKWREALGISADEGLINFEKSRRQSDKAAFSAQAGLDSSADTTLNADMSARLHGALSTSPALAVAVQLEDLLMQKEQPNVPGTTEEQPNWRRKYGASIEQLETITSFQKITDALQLSRPKL